MLWHNGGSRQTDPKPAPLDPKQIGRAPYRPEKGDPVIAARIIERYGTQAQAARAWGADDSFVSKIVRGRRPAPEWVLERLGMV